MGYINQTIEGTFYLSLDGGEVECPAVYEIDGETYPAESYSYGGSRGTEISVIATLKSLHLGNLKIGRRTVVKMVGAADVATQEAHAETNFAESELDAAA